MNSYIERIDGIGVSPNIPEYVKYFKETCLVEELVIPFKRPDIESLISVMVDAKVIDYKLIDTPAGMSYEGQNLSGKKLIVEIGLTQNVKYVSDSETQSIHGFINTDTMKNVFIVIPNEINGEKIEDVIRKKKFSVVPYIEDVYAIRKDCRSVTSYITFLVNVEFY